MGRVPHRALNPEAAPSVGVPSIQDHFVVKYEAWRKVISDPGQVGISQVRELCVYPSNFHSPVLLDIWKTSWISPSNSFQVMVSDCSLWRLQKHITTSL